MHQGSPASEKCPDQSEASFVKRSETWVDMQDKGYDALRILPTWRTSATVVASACVHIGFLLIFSKAGQPTDKRYALANEFAPIAIEVIDTPARDHSIEKAAAAPQNAELAAAEAQAQSLLPSLAALPAANAKHATATKSDSSERGETSQEPGSPAEASDDNGVPSPYASREGTGAGTGTGNGAGTGSGRNAAGIDLGLGEGAFWPRYGQAGTGPVGGSGPTPPAAASARPDIGGLRAALAAHDRQLGLGSGGPVVSAARIAAQSGTADGNATISIKTDASGKVLSVALLDSTTSSAAWAAVARDMAAHLRSSPLRIPRNANGVIVTVRLEAKVRMPSGALPGKNGVPQLDGVGVAGQFDLADIGARPARTVHATIINEQVL